MPFQQIAAVFQRWLWLILVGTAAVTAVAFFLSRSMTPVYNATATILVDIGIPQPGTESSQVQVSERSTKTYAQLVKSQPVLQEVKDTLSLPLSTEGISEKVTVFPIADTQLLRIAVSDTIPARARAIANKLADALVNQTTKMREARFDTARQEINQEIGSIDQEIKTIIARINSLQTATDPTGASLPPFAKTELDSLQAQRTSLETQKTILLRSAEDFRLAATRYASNIVVSSYADLPTSPVSPRTMMNTILAFVLGLLFCTALAFVMEYMDDTFKTPEDITRALGLATMGAIARFQEDEEGERLIVKAEPRSPISEAYRSLRTNLQFSLVDKPLHTLMITSANPQEGKSVTMANLAVAMAQAGLRVIAVDSDLRRPSQQKLFDVPENPGLSNILLQEEPDLDGALHDTGIANLKLLTCGTRPPNPSELLGSERMKRLVSRLKEKADVVMFDTPPLAAVTDAALLASQVDGVLLLIEPGAARRQSVIKARDDLARVGANILGVVLNKLSTRRGGGYYYYHYYYYHYYYTPEGERRKRKVRKARRAPRGFRPVRKLWRWLRGGRGQTPAIAAPSGRQDGSSADKGPATQ